MKRLLLISAFCLLLTTILPAQWQPTNGPFGGNVNGLILKTPYVFALVSGVGVFISSDNGTTWSQRNNGLTNLNVQCIAVKGTRIFLGTSYGLFTSDDNGTTWNTVVLNGRAYFSVTGLGSNAQSVFMLMNNGSSGPDSLFKSDDGTNWVRNLFDQSFFSLGVCGDSVFIGGNNGDFYRSTDNGVNFHYIDLSSYPDLLYPRSFTYSGSFLFATGYTGGIFRSPDNGNTWTQTTGGLANEEAVSLTAYGNKLYAGMNEGPMQIGYQSNGGLYVTTDYINWTYVGLTGISVGRIVISGNRIIAETWLHGIYISDDDGVTWNPSENGLTRLPVLAVTKNGSDLFASCITDPSSGSGDSYGLMKSTDQGATWVHSGSGIPNEPISSFAVSNSIMLAGGYGVYLSSDHGLTWKQIFYPGYSISSLVILNSRIFAGTSGGVFLSDDVGVTWHSANNGLDDANVTAMIAKDNTLFTGTSSGVYRSSDNGSSWTKVRNGLEGYYINALASNNDFLFASGAETTAGIFRSPDNGDHWIKTDIGINFTLFSSVLSLAVSNEKIIAATYYTNSSILYSANNGETWSVLNTGLPDEYDISSVIILDSTVYAGSTQGSYPYYYIGSGVWKRPLSEFIPFELQSDTVLLQATANNSKNLTITSSTSWVLDGQLPGWVSVNKTAGTASDAITFTTTSANPNSWPRYAFLDIVSEGISRPFTVIQKESINGITDQSLKEVSLFPNPTSGNIIINTPSGYNKVTVTTAPGQVLYEQPIISSQTHLDLTRFGKGLYYLRLTGKNNTCIKEIIVL
jgi:photosystem II stability/assembly factor-like uncharacterized protein